MKVFVMLCFYILVLYLPLQVTPKNNDDERDDCENHSRNIEQSALMKTFNDVVSRGNELKNQYAPIIQSVGSWMYSKCALNWVSPSKVVKSIPLIKFAMDHIAPDNEKSGIEEDLFGKQVNLENILEHPELIKPLFSNENTGNVALKSIELVAGPEVTETIDGFVKEVRDNSKDENEEGIQGITGEHLLNILQNSLNIKHLFPHEEITKSIQKAIQYLDSFLCVDDSNTITPGVVSEKGVISNQNGEGKNDISNSNDNTLKESLFKLTRSVSNVLLTARGAQMAFDVGKLMFYENRVKSTISCFLPTSYPRNALKFLCIAMYLMMLAQQEGVIPTIGSDTVGRVNELTGLEIGVLVDKLNNPDIMKKVFPLNDDSSYAVSILKFLAGGEIALIDKVIKILRKFKEEHVSDHNELTITDLLEDSKFFKDLLGMPEMETLTTTIYEGQQLNAATKGANDEVVTGDERRVGERNDYCVETMKEHTYLVAAVYATATEANFQDRKDREEASNLPPSAK